MCEKCIEHVEKIRRYCDAIDKNREAVTDLFHQVQTDMGLYFNDPSLPKSTRAARIENAMIIAYVFSFITSELALSDDEHQKFMTLAHYGGIDGHAYSQARKIQAN